MTLVCASSMLFIEKILHSFSSSFEDLKVPILNYAAASITNPLLSVIFSSWFCVHFAYVKQNIALKENKGSWHSLLGQQVARCLHYAQNLRMCEWFLVLKVRGMFTLKSFMDSTGCTKAINPLPFPPEPTWGYLGIKVSAYAILCKRN